MFSGRLVRSREIQSSSPQMAYLWYQVLFYPSCSVDSSVVDFAFGLYQEFWRFDHHQRCLTVDVWSKMTSKKASGTDVLNNGLLWAFLALLSAHHLKIQRPSLQLVNAAVDPKRSGHIRHLPTAKGWKLQWSFLTRVNHIETGVEDVQQKQKLKHVDLYFVIVWSSIFLKRKSDASKLIVGARTAQL